MDAGIAAHLETLESHVATLEGIIHVMLQEIEAGTIQESAGEIRATLTHLDDS